MKLISFVDITRSLSIILGLVSLQTSLGDTATSKRNQNPLVPGYFADPCIRKFGDTFYLYATPDAWGNGEGIPVIWTSKDFVNWTPHRTNWPSTSNKWAPSVTYTNGKYYMFSSVPCQLWIGVADSPLGPWKNALGSGPAVRDKEPKETITLDGEIFTDSDGQHYLAYGTWWTPTIGKLKPDLLSFLEPPIQYFRRGETKTPNGLIQDCMEAPYIVKRGETYFLMYSDKFCGNSTYQVKYSTGKSPLGPWTYGKNNPILATNIDNSVDGPGHHSIINDSGKDVMVYHRHDNPHHEDGSHRQVCADRMTFDGPDSIAPIKPSHRGVGFLAPSIKRDTNWVMELGAKVKASSSSSAGMDFSADNAADINNGTLWKASTAKYPQWLSIDLGQVKPVKRIETDFQYPALNYRYKVEYSKDGRNWSLLVDRSAEGDWRHSVDELQSPVSGQYFRITLLGDDSPERPNPEIGIWNFKLYDGVAKPYSAPVVDAGKALTCTSDIPRVDLEGDAFDPGLPMEVKWSKVSGPGSVSFSDSTDPSATATFSAPGEYVLELAAKNRVGRTCARVKINVKKSLPALLAKYDFEEPAGTVVRDQSDSSLHGRLASDSDVTGNPLRSPGVSGYGLLFNGRNNLVKLPGLGQQSALTATMWLKFDRIGEAGLLNSVASGFKFGIDKEGKLQLTMSKDPSSIKSAVSMHSIGIGRWVNVGFQYDGATKRARFLVEGQPENWQAVPGGFPIDLQSGMQVGVAQGKHFAGKLDALRMYRGLTFDQQSTTRSSLPKDASLATVNTATVGTELNIRMATVTYAPYQMDGTRATNKFFIQTAGSSDTVEVRSGGDIVKPNVGVTFRGKIQADKASGNRYLEVLGPIEIESAPSVDPIKAAKLSELQAYPHGSLVTVSGDIASFDQTRRQMQISSTVSTLKQPLVEVVNETSSFSRMLQPGNTVKVTGVVSRDKDGFRLLLLDAQRVSPAYDPLEDGLLASYRFEGSAMDELDSERSGRANSPVWGRGYHGQGLELNGKNSDVSLPDLGVYSSVTIAAWVKPEVLRPWQAIFHTNQFEPNKKLHLTLFEDGSLLLATSGNTPVDHRTKPLLTASKIGDWNHIALVYDSPNNLATVYLNGEQVAKFEYAYAGPIALTGGMRLGSWGGGDRFFKGMMDEVFIYGRAFGPDEVRLLMRNPR